MQGDVKHEVAYRRALKAVLKRSCHPKQRALVDDSNDLVATLAGRRGGKSHGWAVKVLLTCVDNPGEEAICVALTEGKAVQIFWNAFKRIGKTLGIDLKLRKVNGQASVITPWSNRIWLAGCDNKKYIEKLRGDRYCCAVIDEADSLRPLLQQIIEDALGPALTDLGGWLGLSGTPGATPNGYFFDATAGHLVDWSVHTWDVRDNPHMPDPELIFAKAKRRMPEATFQREWMGRWTLDTAALVFSFDAQRNGCRVADLKGQLQTVIGIDLGYVDACAWCVMQYIPGMPERYIVHAHSASKLTPSRAGVVTEQLMRKFPGAQLIGDTGGLGKAYIVEWAERLGINVSAAQKTDKAGSMALMGNDVANGNIKVDPHEAGGLLDEWSVLLWNEKRTDFDARSMRTNANGERSHGDIAHAALYAWKAVQMPYNPQVEPDMSPQAQQSRLRAEIAAQKRRANAKR